MGEFRTVWTRQVPQVEDELKRSGRYIVREEYVRAKNDTISDYYLELYRWLAAGCRRRGLASMPSDAMLPIWVALTPGTRLGKVEGAISLTLSVPEENLLVIDYNKWGYRVNDWYVPESPEDERAFNLELARLGIANEAALVMGSQGNFYPAQKSKICRSWERIFDEGPAEDDEQNVGVLWEIRSEWAKDIEHYAAEDKEASCDGGN